jgi:hypothetical protein
MCNGILPEARGQVNTFQKYFVLFFALAVRRKTDIFCPKSAIYGQMQVHDTGVDRAIFMPDSNK